MQQLQQKVEEDEETINRLTQEQEVEDNIGFIFEIHKNVAMTPFYKEVVQDDPLLEQEVDQEQYEGFFEENYNDIGNNIINYVQYLAANLEEQLTAVEERDEKIEELSEKLEIMQ